MAVGSRAIRRSRKLKISFFTQFVSDHASRANVQTSRANPSRDGREVEIAVDIGPG